VVLGPTSKISRGLGAGSARMAALHSDLRAPDEDLDFNKIEKTIKVLPPEPWPDPPPPSEEGTISNAVVDNDGSPVFVSEDIKFVSLAAIPGNIPVRVSEHLPPGSAYEYEDAADGQHCFIISPDMLAKLKQHWGMGPVSISVKKEKPVPCRWELIE